MMSVIVVAAFGVPSGIGISSMIFYLCSCIIGQNFIHVMIHSALLCFASLYFVKKRFPKVPRKTSRFKSLSRYDIIPSAIYLLMSFYITWKIYLPAPRSFSLSFESQLTEELSLISSFYQGVNSGFCNPFHVHHPNFSDHYAVSHWLTAFHSSMLQYGFASLKMSLFVPTSLLLSSFSILSYYLALQFQLPPYLAFLAPIINVLLSGFGFLRFLHNNKRTNRTNDYVSQSGYGKYPRFHPVFHIIYGFRHTTLALPLSVGIIYILYWSVKYRHSISGSMLSFAGFVVGFVMPATQHQTFIGFIIFFSVFLLLQLSSRNFPKLRGFALMFFIGFLFHFPRYANLDFLKSALSIEVQWKQLIHHEFVPLFSLWWNNCGIFIIIYLFLSWFQLNSIEYYLYLPSLACFLVFNFWKLQECAQYNTFLFFCLVYPIGSVVFISTLYRFVLSPSEPEFRGVIAALGVIAFLSCTISAAMGIHKQIGNARPLWGMSDEHTAKWIVEKTSKNAVFVAPIVVFNPVPVLTGRRMYFDNTEVLTHAGFNFSQREAEYAKFMKNANSSEEALNKIDYVVMNSNDDNRFLEKWKEIYHNRDYVIFQRKK